MDRASSTSSTGLRTRSVAFGRCHGSLVGEAMKRMLVVFIGVIIAVGALVIAVPAGAAGPPLSSYVVYGENGVVVGNGSVVTGFVGAQSPVPGTTTALTLQGQSKIISAPGNGIVGDARSGGNVRLLNSTLIQGTLTH